MRIVHHPNIVELKAFYYFDGDRVRDTDVRTVWKVELSAFRALARLLFDSGFYFPHCPERNLVCSEFGTSNILTSSGSNSHVSLWRWWWCLCLMCC